MKYCITGLATQKALVYRAGQLFGNWTFRTITGLFDVRAIYFHHLWCVNSGQKQPNINYSLKE